MLLGNELYQNILMDTFTFISPVVTLSFPDPQDYVANRRISH